MKHEWTKDDRNMSPGLFGNFETSHPHFFSIWKIIYASKNRKEEKKERKQKSYLSRIFS